MLWFIRVICDPVIARRFSCVGFYKPSTIVHGNLVVSVSGFFIHPDHFTVMYCFHINILINSCTIIRFLYPSTPRVFSAQNDFLNVSSSFEIFDIRIFNSNIACPALSGCQIRTQIVHVLNDCFHLLYFLNTLLPVYLLVRTLQGSATLYQLLSVS